jgi:hypothetical protein
MSPPRFRLRTLLVAVAVVGVALGSVRLWRRSQACRALAVLYAFQEAESLHAEAMARFDLESSQRRLNKAREEAKEHADRARRKSAPRWSIAADELARYAELLDEIARSAEFQVRKDQPRPRRVPSATPG